VKIIIKSIFPIINIEPSSNSSKNSKRQKIKWTMIAIGTMIIKVTKKIPPEKINRPSDSIIKSPPTMAIWSIEEGEDQRDPRIRRLL
jgi:hypothetical protein